MTDTTTQNLRILGHLKTAGSITPREALNDYGCMRLAARIHDLRTAGYPIQTHMVTRRGKRFAQYLYAGV